jgi:hypothetical protein
MVVQEKRGKLGGGAESALCFQSAAILTMNSRIAEHLRQFWSGLTTITLSSALLAVGFAILEFCAAVVFVTPKSLAHLRPRWLMENRVDDSASTTIDALRTRQKGGTSGVIFLGASNARMSLTRNGLNMPRRLARAVGRDVEYRQFFRDSQNMAEWIAILDQLPPSFRGVVVLSVLDTKRTLIRASSDPRTVLAINSPSLENPSPLLAKGLRVAGPMPFRTGVYFLDHLQFFAARRASLVRLGGAMARGTKTVNGVARQSRKNWGRHLAKLRRKRPPAMLELLPYLEEIIGKLHERGNDVVLLEAPVNPLFDRWKPAEHSRAAEYEPEMLSFAKRLGVHYWNPSVEAGLVSGDFKDPIHVVSRAGRRAYERVVVQHLAKLLNGEAVPDGPVTPEVEHTPRDLAHIESLLTPRPRRSRKALDDEEQSP